jgi:anti-sigma B factor antagonist
MINMNQRTVIVTQLPPMDAKRARNFLRRLAESMTTIIRPGVVLDCSSLDRFDAGTLDLLLCCLEEALKYNGDVRLAALHPDVKALLDSTGAGNLFRTFGTINEAAESFRRPVFSGVEQPADISGQEILPSADAA